MELSLKDRTMALIKQREKDRKESNRRSRLRWKIACFEAYGGAKCACCGESSFHFLTLDHADNDGNIHRKKLIDSNGNVGNFYRHLVLQNFPQEHKLQVMCWNCNMGKRSNDGVCPHVEMRVHLPTKPKRKWREIT